MINKIQEKGQDSKSDGDGCITIEDLDVLKKGKVIPIVMVPKQFKLWIDVTNDEEFEDQENVEDHNDIGGN